MFDLPDDILWPVHITGNTYGNISKELREYVIQRLEKVNDHTFQTNEHLKQVKCYHGGTFSERGRVIACAWIGPENTDERVSEIQYCLNKNINNPIIDKIICFTEGCSDVIVPDHEKVSIIKHPTHVSYNVVMDYLRTIVQDHDTIVLHNSDCYFDHTLNRIHAVNLDDQVVVLTRHDRIEDNQIIFGRNTNFGDNLKNKSFKINEYKKLPILSFISSDAWIFNIKLFSHRMKSTVLVGTVACEQRFLNYVYKAGFQPINLGLGGFIMCIHNHLSGIRNTSSWDRSIYDFKPHEEFPFKDKDVPVGFNNYIVNSWMAYTSSNFYYDDRFSGQLGRYFVRDFNTVIDHEIE